MADGTPPRGSVAGERPSAGPSLRDLAARTPPDRNRYVDALRAFSICVVVLGHWTVGAIAVTDDGLLGVNLLSVAAWSHPFTWLFQVMPVFFLVGGYANAASLRSHRRRGGTTASWVRLRALRLLRPTAAFLVVLAGVRVLGPLLGADERFVRAAVWTAAAPLWFLVVYLAVVVVTPVADAAYRRWRLATVAVLVVGVVVGDALRLVTGEAAAAGANYLLAWLAVHQAGIAWHDGALPRTRAAAWGLVAAGLGSALLLTGLGPYGVAMVGAAVPPGLTNTAPPTIALLALATAQVGVLLLLQEPARSWLARTRVWMAVVLLNSAILTVFLWHMVALVIGGVVLYGTGLLPQPEIGSGAWFLLRFPWLAALAVVLVGLVALMRRWEAPVRANPREHPSPVAVGVGIAATLGGMASLGLSDTRGVAPQLAGVPVVELALVAIGIALLSRPGRPSQGGDGGGREQRPTHGENRRALGE